MAKLLEKYPTGGRINLYRGYYLQKYNTPVGEHYGHDDKWAVWSPDGEVVANSEMPEQIIMEWSLHLEKLQQSEG